MKPLLTFLLYLLAGIVIFLIIRFTGRKYVFPFKLYPVAAPVITAIYILFSFRPYLLHQPVAPELIHFIAQDLGVLGDALISILGYCLTGIARELIKGAGNTVIAAYFAAVIKGLCLQTGLIFISATIGKSVNRTFMVQFFKSSGYTVGFLYFIMFAEAFCGILLLFNSRFYLKLIAVIMLLSIMTGALVTHIRNHDPLDDSGAAILLGFELILLLILLLFGRKKANLGIGATT